jgi:cell wall-active antibiotic response 4TMS protein YvqF
MAYRRGLIGPLALLVIGGLLLLRNLGYLPASLDQWWPAILILIGLWLLFVRSASGETTTPQGPGPVAPPPGHAPPTEGRRHAPTGGLIMVGLGLALLGGNLLGQRSVGALVMIAVGLTLLIARVW